MYGLDYYQNVRYGLVTENGQTGIEVELDERAWGPNYLQLGMEYSSAADSDALFGLAASYLRTAINPLGGEWRTTIIIGDEPALISDLYQPFGSKGLYFYTPSFILESNQFNVYIGDQRVTEAQLREATVEFAIGRELPTWGEYRFGVRATKGEFDLRVGDPSFISDEDFRRGEFFGRFSVDTMDSVSFPREGSSASLEYRLSRQRPLAADADFDQLLLAGSYAKTWGAHGADDSALRHDDQRRSVRQPAVSHGRVLRHLGPQPQSALGPARGARGRELLPAHRRPRAVSGVCRHEHRAREYMAVARGHLARPTAYSAARSGPASARRWGRSTSATGAPKAARTRSTFHWVACSSAGPEGALAGVSICRPAVERETTWRSRPH